MRNTRKSTLAEVSMSVIKAAFGMSERMEKSLALKVAAAKVLGGTLGAAFSWQRQRGAWRCVVHQA